MDTASARRFGLLMVTGAAVLWSTAGLFVRLIDLDVWTTLAWRSVFAALALAVVIVIQNGAASARAVGAIGRPGLAAIPVAVVSMAAYVVALKLTSVANVMVIYATVPFVAAGIAFFWLGERAPRRVVVASAMAFAGVAVMAATETHPRDIAGNAVAFLMTLAFGLQLVMARRYPALDMGPVNMVAALVCAIAVWPLVAVPVPAWSQLVLLALFGATNTAMAYSLFLIGGRHVPSSEAGLIGMLDVILGPFWVWLAFRETPGPIVVAGGLIVLGALAWYLIGVRRQARG